MADEGETAAPVCLPCARKRCCCGWISSPVAVQLIAVTELIILAVYLMQAGVYAVRDGQVFYTAELQGGGGVIALGSWCYGLTSAAVIALLLVGQRNDIPSLFLPHLIWQVVTVVLSLRVISAIVARASEDATPPSHRIAVPSATVLVVFFAIPALLETWWLAVVAELCYNTRQQNRKSQPMAIIL